MVNKMSIISRYDVKVIEELIPTLTDAQNSALVHFGAQMYHDGWFEWGPRFFAAGMLTGIVSIAAPLIYAKLKNQKTSDK